MTINELRRQRGDAYAEMDNLVLSSEGRTMTAVEIQKYEEFKEKFDRAGGAIEALDPTGATAPRDLSGDIPDIAESFSGSRPAYDPLKDKRTTGGVPVLRSAQRLSNLPPTDGSPPEPSVNLDTIVRSLVTGDWSKVPVEERAMSIGTPSAGGFAVPEALSSRIIDRARNQARVLQAGALTVPMESNTLKLARVVGDPTAAWKVENAQASASDMTLEAVTFTVRTLISIVKASVELVEDADQIDDTIESALASALSLELDRVSLRGSGTAPEPRGIRNQTGVTIQSLGANGATPTYANFSTAVQTVRENNGEPNAAIIAPRTAGTLDRLVDSTGQPLRAPTSYEELRILTSAQIPVNLTQGTSVDTSEAYVGDWSSLLIGVRRSITIEVSRQASTGGESAFDRLQVHIRAYLRADVQLSTPAHFVVMTGLRP